MLVGREIIQELLEKCPTFFDVKKPVDVGMLQVFEAVQSHQLEFLTVEAVASGWMYRDGGDERLLLNCAEYLKRRYSDCSPYIQKKEKEYYCSLPIRQINNKVLQVLTDVSEDRQLLRRQHEWRRSQARVNVKTISELIEGVADEVCLVEALKQESGVAIEALSQKIRPLIRRQVRLYNSLLLIDIPLDDDQLNQDAEDIVLYSAFMDGCWEFHKLDNFDPLKSSFSHWVKNLIFDQRLTKQKYDAPGMLFRVLKDRGAIDFDYVEFIQCHFPIPNQDDVCRTEYELVLTSECCPDSECHALFEDCRDMRIRKRKYFSPANYDRQQRYECGHCGNLLLPLTGSNVKPQCPRDESSPKAYAHPQKVYVYDGSIRVEFLDALLNPNEPSFCSLIPVLEDVGIGFLEEPEETSSEESRVERDDEILSALYETSEAADLEDPSDEILSDQLYSSSHDEMTAEGASLDRMYYLLRKFNDTLDGLPRALWFYLAYEGLYLRYEATGLDRDRKVFWKTLLRMETSLSEASQFFDVYHWIVLEKRKLPEVPSGTTQKIQWPVLAEQFNQNRRQIETALNIKLPSNVTTSNLRQCFSREILKPLKEILSIIAHFEKLTEFVERAQGLKKVVLCYLFAEQREPTNREWSIVLEYPPGDITDDKLPGKELLDLYVWFQWEKRKRYGRGPLRRSTLAQAFEANRYLIQQALDLTLHPQISGDDIKTAEAEIRQFFEELSALESIGDTSH